MTCDEFRDLLSDFIDDELDGEQRSEAETHVSSCEACALERKKMLRTVRFVRANASPLPFESTAAATYADFHRSLVDDGFAKTPGDVLKDELRAIFARRAQQQAEGRDA